MLGLVSVSAVVVSLVIISVLVGIIPISLPAVYMLLSLCALTGLLVARYRFDREFFGPNKN